MWVVVCCDGCDVFKFLIRPRDDITRRATTHRLLRVMAGLWPTTSGKVRRPPRVGRDGILFVPQRPYTVAEGSLRTQVTYPRSYGK